MTEEHPYDESNRRYLEEVAKDSFRNQAAGAVLDLLALGNSRGLALLGTNRDEDSINVVALRGNSHYVNFTLKVMDLEISEVYADEAIYDDPFEEFE